jgi:hypothetical protein
MYVGTTHQFCTIIVQVGSESAQGAGGPVMRDTVKRVARALSDGEEGAVERSMRASFLVSADMAHALHPNYSDKHEPDHQPKFHEGKWIWDLDFVLQVSCSLWQVKYLSAILRAHSEFSSPSHFLHPSSRSGPQAQCQSKICH